MCLRLFYLLLASIAASSLAEAQTVDQPDQETGPSPVLTRNPSSVAGEAGLRQNPEDLSEALRIEPMKRIEARIQNRLENRIRNRVDRNYDSRSNVTDPFEEASDRQRAARTPQQR